MAKKPSAGKALHNILLYSVLGIYILILFAFLFLKRTSFCSVNLVPFKSIMNYLNGDLVARAFAVNNILGNIVLFFPLGVYISLLNTNKNTGVSVCLVAFISAAAEAAQYLFRVGTLDIDDVILNTLGGLAGILTFKLIRRIFGEKARTAIEISAPITGFIAVLILILSNRPQR